MPGRRGASSCLQPASRGTLPEPSRIPGGAEDLGVGDQRTGRVYVRRYDGATIDPTAVDARREQLEPRPLPVQGEAEPDEVRRPSDLQRGLSASEHAGRSSRDGRQRLLDREVGLPEQGVQAGLDPLVRAGEVGRARHDDLAGGVDLPVAIAPGGEARQGARVADEDHAVGGLGADQDAERGRVEVVAVGDERGVEAVVRGLLPDRIGVAGESATRSRCPGACSAGRPPRPPRGSSRRRRPCGRGRWSPLRRSPCG